MSIKTPVNEYVYKQLINLLQQAAELCNENIQVTENFDLEDLGHTLNGYLRELNNIGAFESYSDDK